jgi:hypothetical protein
MDLMYLLLLSRRGVLLCLSSNPELSVKYASVELHRLLRREEECLFYGRKLGEYLCLMEMLEPLLMLLRKVGAVVSAVC